MYKPSYLFDRTPEEKRDMFKSWARSDQAFFASGACHILADLFVQLHQHEGYKMVHIKPAESFTGNHVYAQMASGLLTIMAGPRRRNSWKRQARHTKRGILTGSMKGLLLRVL